MNEQNSNHRLLLLFLLAIISATFAISCKKITDKPKVVNNDSDQLLRQMSKTLAQAKKLSFKVDRKLDAAVIDGQKLPENAQIDFSVSRPRKFIVKSDSQGTVRTAYFDGQSLSIYDRTMNGYATESAPGTIDDVIDDIDEEFDFTPPLWVFFLSDPYGTLGPEIKTQDYKGKESIAGVECHHLSLSTSEADSEIWIGTADLLPHKLVATFKNREGKPKLQAEFSSWNLAATFDDNIFAFVPPKDARKVDVEEMARTK